MSGGKRMDSIESEDESLVTSDMRDRGAKPTPPKKQWKGEMSEAGMTDIVFADDGDESSTLSFIDNKQDQIIEKEKADRKMYKKKAKELKQKPSPPPLITT